MTNLTKIFSSWYFRWFLVGIFIRLILSAITLHPDLWAFSFPGKIFVEQGILNIYDYLHNLPLSSLYRVYGTDFFTYPPLAYFVLGIFRFILQPFFDPNFYPRLFANFGQAFLVTGIFRHALLIKLPYLVFDLSLAFLLTEFFQEEKKKRLAFLIWIFNPVSWYTSFMIGQFDIIPTFFIVLSLVFALKTKNNFALLSLGIGGAFKIFPLLLVPFAAVILGKNNWEKSKLFIFGLLPFLITISPFLSSKAFRSVVIFGAQSQKLLYAGINVSGADVIYLFLVFYLLLLFYAFYFSGKIQSLWKFFLAVFLLIFSLTNYHTQWFLWITPFLIIFVVEYPSKLFIPISLFILFIGTVFLFEPSLSIGLFSPLVPSIARAQGFSVFVGRFLPPTQISSYLRSIFAAVSIWLIFDLLIHQETIREKT